MNTICFPTTQGNLYNPFSDRGTSETAQKLQELIREIWNKLSKDNIAFGEPHFKAMVTLDELRKECSRDNWDGYGAKSINLNSYYEAKRLLETWPITVSLPEIIIEPDGEIAFEWYKGPYQTFSISIGGVNKISYAGIFNDSKTHGTEDIEDELPKTILDFIKRVFI